MTMPRETGSEKYEAVCFNCGGPCPTVENANGVLSPGPCPVCFPSPQTASAPLPREVATPQVDANVVGESA